MSVDVQIGCDADTPDPETMRRWALDALDAAPAAVCVRIVGEREGARLNGRFRDRQDATNVLAFPAEEAGVLGDIAICAPVVEREARAQGKALRDHYAHLVVHGVLHLLGMDHQTAAEAQAMEAREVALLERLGVGNPYGAAP